MKPLGLTAAPLALAIALIGGNIDTVAAAPMAQAAPAAAANAGESGESGDLPAAAQAIAAIRQSPQVQAAIAAIDAEDARRAGLEAGPHEWAIRLSGQQRRVDASTSAAPERYREWTASLERPVRLPGKAALDSAIGAQASRQARAAYADALHETARGLLAAWFVWLREVETTRQWQNQAESLDKQRAATARRVTLGDGSRLELMQAEAAAAQARAALEQAKRRSAIAASDLLSRFPGLTLPTAPAIGEPQALDGELADWRTHLLEHNHELRLARAATRQARLLARRSDAERIPDPTFGVHVGADRGGEEKLTGLSIGIPLPGDARAAGSRRDSALAVVAAQREAATLAKVNAEIAATLTAAERAWAGWQSSEDAAQRLEQAAALMARARSLGEAGLGEVLLAQRQANEARLAANASRLEAREARYRLLLDTHQLWAYADEESEDEEDPDAMAR